MLSAKLFSKPCIQNCASFVLPSPSLLALQCGENLAPGLGPRWSESSPHFKVSLTTQKSRGSELVEGLGMFSLVSLLSSKGHTILSLAFKHTERKDETEPPW